VLDNKRIGKEEKLVMKPTCERAKKRVRGRNEICLSLGKKYRGKIGAIVSNTVLVLTRGSAA
jgi:hypothetical protein